MLPPGVNSMKKRLIPPLAPKCNLFQRGQQKSGYCYTTEALKASKGSEIQFIIEFSSEEGVTLLQRQGMGALPPSAQDQSERSLASTDKLIVRKTTPQKACCYSSADALWASEAQLKKQQPVRENKNYPPEEGAQPTLG